MPLSLPSGCDAGSCDLVAALLQLVRCSRRRGGGVLGGAGEVGRGGGGSVRAPALSVKMLGCVQLRSKLVAALHDDDDAPGVLLAELSANQGDDAAAALGAAGAVLRAMGPLRLAGNAGLRLRAKGCVAALALLARAAASSGEPRPP